MTTLRQVTRHDIFPALSIFIGIGTVAGAIASLLVSILVTSANDQRLVYAAFGAGLGAILGLFIGLSRGVWLLGAPASGESISGAPDHLWDPWLDTGHDSHDGLSEGITMAGGPEYLLSRPDIPSSLPMERARVRPRIVSPITGEAVALDDHIGQIIEHGRYKNIGLLGGPGSGKSTAIRHLQAVLPPWALAKVLLVDDPEAALDSSVRKNDCLVISTGSWLARDTSGVVFYSLASWGQDDVIEYLLSTHWDQCANVMARLKTSEDRGFLKGIPELWAVVLDQMARDESVLDIRAALRRELSGLLNLDPNARVIAEDFCLTGVGQDLDPVLNSFLSTLSGDVSVCAQRAKDLLRLVRHRPVALLLAADRIKDLTEHGRPQSVFSRRFSPDLVHEAAATIAGNNTALHHLTEWLSRPEHSAIHPMAASLIHAAAPGWRPASDYRPRLTGAYLTRAAWPGIDLSRVTLESADLKDADLSRANLKKSQVSRARFSRANLREASLESWVALGADLSGADMRSVQAMRANFCQANLAGACLVEANLWRANLQKANIEGSDFTGANLEEARLSGLRLRDARIDLARFGGANLRNCDLEEIMLTVPDFHDADLRGALLTGSCMQEANFVGANLRGAGLAEIDWPGADLHDADLRGVSFHLGSSRSGLVDSPIACEGSRTGFYTDDYDEQYIKSTAEIRKANLRGADLRGANIEGVDFYLVDLCDAKYTREQAKHFRHCRAILEDRSR